MTTQKTSSTPPASVESPAAPKARWTPKSATDVVMEQVSKQEKKVASLRAELVREEKQLSKLEAARKAMES